MKRFSWIIFLGVFLAMMVSPALAAGIEWNKDTKTVTFTSASQDLKLWNTANEGSSFDISTDVKHIVFQTGTYRIGKNFSLDIKGRSVDIIGSGDVTLIGSGDKEEGRTFPVITISGTAANGTIVTGITFRDISRDAKSKNDGGAAIAVISADNVIISNCVFDRNMIHSSAIKDSNSVEHIGGAGIYVRDAATLQIESCDFSGNMISCDLYDGGKNHGNYGQTLSGGGAIYVLALSKDTTVTITSSDFTKNTLKVSSDTGASGLGGAITALIPLENQSSDGDTATKVTLNINGSKFEKNSAGFTGGAIALITDIGDSGKHHGSIDLTVKNSVFSNNVAGGSDSQNSGAKGGAIVGLSWNGRIDVNIESSKFDGNYASTNILISSGTVKYLAGSGGGAIALETGVGGYITASIDNSLFEDNKANWGGAIDTWGNSGSVDLKVTNSSFHKNSLVLSQDSTANAYTWGQSKFVYYVGSAIASRAATNHTTTNTGVGRAYTTIVNSTFWSNDAYYGGAVANIVSDDGSFVSTDIVHSTFVNNKASDDKAGADIFAVMNGNQGKTSSDIHVYDSIFYNNSNKYYAIGAQSADAVISLDKVAYVKDYLLSDDKITSASVKGYAAAISIDVDKFEAASKDAKKYKTLTIEVANEKTTIELPYFPLAATDDDNLIKGGSSKDVSNKDIPSYSNTDFLGVSFDTKAPSLGAVQYKLFGLSLDLTGLTESDDVVYLGPVYRGQKVSVDFVIESADPSLDIASVDFKVVDIAAEGADSADFSYSFDVNTLTVSAEKPGVYTFTVTANGKEGTDYVYVTDEQKFKLTVSNDAISIVVTSTDNGATTVASTADELKSADLVSVKVSYNGSDVTEAGGYTLSWSTTSPDSLVKVSSADGTVTTTASSFTTAGTYYLPIKVTVTSNDDTTISDDDEAIAKVTVAVKAAVKLSATPTTATAIRGGDAVTITVSADTSDDATATWGTLSGDSLGTGEASATNTYVISVTASETAELGAHTYTVSASVGSDNNTAEDSIDVTVTVVDAAVTFTTNNFAAPKGVPVSSTVVSDAKGTGITWSLGGDDLPDWVEISDYTDSTLVLKAEAPTSVKTNTAYTFQVIATNKSGTDAAEAVVSKDVTVTVAGTISSDGSYTSFDSGVFTATPVSKTNGTNAAGQPTVTTTSVFRNGAGDVMLSIDIMITAESTDLRTRVDQKYETPISVDVSIDLKDTTTYDSYVYSFDVAGAPFLSVAGSKTGTSADVASGHVTHNFKLTGTPEASGDFTIAVTFNAMVSGDIPVLAAVNSMDMNLVVDVALVNNEGDGTDESGNATVSHLSEPMTLADAIQEILDHIDDPEAVKTITLPDNITQLSGGLALLHDALPNLTAIDISNSNMLTDTALDLSSSSLSWLTGVSMDGQTTITTVTLTGSKVENFSAKGSNLATLTVAGSDVKTLEVSETNLTTLDTSNCDNLETLDANQCDSLETLKIEDCKALTSVSAQGKPHTRGQKPTGIRTVDLARCAALTTLDLSSNRILRQNLNPTLGLGALTNVDMGDQHERITVMTRRFSILTLFFGNILNSSVEGDEAIQLTEEQSEEIARVKGVVGYDAAGTPISASYDDKTGEMIFSSTPTTFKYIYDTQAVSNSTLDAEIEPGKVEAADASTPGEGSGSGGCDAGFGLCAAAMALATLLLKKR